MPIRYLSLFSGIEAASAAWHPLGWQCVAVAEIEPFPCAVLAHHYPDVPNLGDVSAIDEERIAALGPIDLVVFGSPCQDLSVAGKRAGLQGERSGLFHVAIRILEIARRRNGCRFGLWENVPGAFSSNAGRDFAAVVGALAGLDDVAVPPKGWGNEGCAVGEKGMVEWATLDAQWFGVAQRRRRVFALADFGDWASRPPILLEPESLRGDSAPRREAGERVAPSLAGGTGGGCGHQYRQRGNEDAVVGVDGGSARGVKWPADVASTLNAAFGEKQGLEDQHALNGAPLFVPAVVGALTAKGPAAMGAPEVDGGHYIMSSGQANASITRGVTGALDCLHEAPIVAAPTCFSADDYKTGSFEQTDVARGLTTTADRTRGAPIVAFAQNQRDEVRAVAVAGALAAEPGMKQQTYIAFPIISDADRSDSSARTPSPDAEGRVRLRDPGIGIGKDGDPMFTLQATKPHAIAFSAKDHGADAGEIAPTLRSMNHAGSHANGGGQVVVCYGLDEEQNGARELMGTLKARREGGGFEAAVAFESRFVRNGRGAPSDVVPPLKAQSGETGKGDAAPLVACATGDRTHALTTRSAAEEDGTGRGTPIVPTAMQVRRLTPTECERLQGFSDGWTQVPYRGKPAADGPRYKALGNSMAVPVMAWIGRQVAAALAMEV